MIPKNRYNNDELPANIYGQKNEPLEVFLQPTTKDILKRQLVDMQPTTLRQTYTLFSGEIETLANQFEKIETAFQTETEQEPS